MLSRGQEGTIGWKSPGTALFSSSGKRKARAIGPEGPRRENEWESVCTRCGIISMHNGAFG